MTATIIDLHTRRPIPSEAQLHYDATIPEALAAAREALAAAVGGTRSAAVIRALAEADSWLEGLEGALCEETGPDED